MSVTSRRIIFAVLSFVIPLAFGLGTGVVVGYSIEKPIATKVIVKPAQIMVSFPKPGVVSIETERCWIIVNIVKKSTYYHCNDTQDNNTIPSGGELKKSSLL